MQACERTQPKQKAYKTIGFDRIAPSANANGIAFGLDDGIVPLYEHSERNPVMKSIKKRCKAVLTEIQQIADELILLSEDIEHLGDMQAFAKNIHRACKELKQQISNLSKKDLAAGLANTPVLQILEDASDRDLISSVEEAFFAHTEDNADKAEHVLFQQLLTKLEQRHALLLTKIQYLQAILEQDMSDQ